MTAPVRLPSPRIVVADRFEESYVGDDDSQFYRRCHERTLNTMNRRYLLPADDDEIRRFQLHHRLVQFVLGGRNYVGPLKEIVTSPEFKHKKRILDLGTGAGIWAIDIADEFPRAEIVGVDLAPLQPRVVPPNCSFELCDLDHPSLPYLTNYFDVIHARSMHMGISNYPRLIAELTRMLRPGGLLILIEEDSQPIVDGHLMQLATDASPASTPLSTLSRYQRRSSSAYASGAPGWFALWEAYRNALAAQGIDVDVPRRMGTYLSRTEAYERIVVQEAMIPIGFWPKDPTLLTVGQLAWMEHDLLLPAMRPYLLSSGLPEWKVKALVEDAQRDMYEPVMAPSSRLHVVHAVKKS